MILYGFLDRVNLAGVHAKFFPLVIVKKFTALVHKVINIKAKIRVSVLVWVRYKMLVTLNFDGAR